jgi:restriction system protein
MSRKSPSILTIFSYLPWWASMIAGLVIFITMKYVFPILAGENQILLSITMAAKNFAWLFASLFMISAITSVFKRRKRKQLISHQKSIETLRETHWSDFEILVGEAFRRKGYSVSENMIGGADGGIDLSLSKDGKLHIVQCKQWRSSKVSVSVVREMFGVMKAANAESVFIVASGTFTKDAIAFARGLPIELIGGHELLELITDVQSNVDKSPSIDNETVSQCPKCASPLVKRIAKQGAHKGNEFLGCSSFPKCRFIQN